MNQQDLQYLADIYNGLLRVHTCGEDSYILTACMKSLFDFIKEKSEEQKQTANALE